ncbi:uncharacterized protein [Aegilops tauschii subsp. strangulata]|uniref:uncharacterized protein isoform X3 n=1 Tax=Aegilops tauschii subsp. strangulata TaxID=200361 RepID=UPI003CC8CA31
MLAGTTSIPKRSILVYSTAVFEILLRIFFKELEANVLVSKKQKVKHLDEKKKKCKAGKVETHLEFPGRKKVKFGEVVEAPPKLSFPKR